MQRNDDFKKTNSIGSDPIDSYFECISSCDIEDGSCILECVEILKNSQN